MGKKEEKKEDKKVIKKKKREEYNYFKQLAKLVEYSVKSANFVHQTLKNFDGSINSEKMEAIHVIEHQADLCKHEMMNKLMKEFITPIEREDIIKLAQEIDNVTDYIEDILIKMHIFNVTTLKEEVLDFTDLLSRCCDSLEQALKEFHNYKKSKTLQELLININCLEEEGDVLYTKAMRKLYANPGNAIEVVVWTELFECMEKCFDACEDVADEIETVVMKNS